MRSYIAALVLSTLPFWASADPVLLMAEEDGCFWCERWNAEISEIYPKTAEGRAAPLRRYNLHQETPDVKFAARVHYTPTFILVRDGEEVARIEGYPGEDFFWALLSKMLQDARIPLDQTG